MPMSEDCHEQKAEWRRMMLGERTWRVRLEPG
jgi:hypothetical protein